MLKSNELTLSQVMDKMHPTVGLKSSHETIRLPGMVMVRIEMELGCVAKTIK